MNDSPYLSGYIFEEDGNIQGYAMIAKSFPQSLESLVYGLRIYILEKHTEDWELEAGFLLM